MNKRFLPKPMTTTGWRGHLRTFWTINVVNLALFFLSKYKVQFQIYLFHNFFVMIKGGFDMRKQHRILFKFTGSWPSSYNIDGPDGMCVGIGFDTPVNNTDIEFRFFRDFLGAEVHKHAFEKGLCIFVFTGTNAALFIRRWKKHLGMINWVKILYSVIQF